jgi:hypothetical protein
MYMCTCVCVCVIMSWKCSVSTVILLSAGLMINDRF